MKILYVHNYYEVETYRVKAYSAIQKLSEKSDIIFNFYKGYKRNFIDKFMYKLKLHNDPCQLNKRLVAATEEFKPDIIFLVKATNIRPKTLRLLRDKNIKLVSWSNDDMFAWHNRSVYYSKGLKYYDLVVTQKSYNCNKNELPSLGAKKMLFQNKAVDSEIFNYNIDCKKSEYKHDVIFIGTYEKERLKILKFLGENGIKIHIYGWSKKVTKNYKNLYFKNKHLYGQSYVEAFRCSKISLNFLRKKNRDLQTSRSIEIPASKGFMIAERTQEHQNLFEENKEAVYFSDKSELLHKIKYYLTHDKERNEISQRGYERCKKNNYTFENRMEEIIKNLI